jgi:hypothetical protein
MACDVEDFSEVLRNNNQGLEGAHAPSSTSGSLVKMSARTLTKVEDGDGDMICVKFTREVPVGQYISLRWQHFPSFTIVPVISRATCRGAHRYY